MVGGPPATASASRPTPRSRVPSSASSELRRAPTAGARRPKSSLLGKGAGEYARAAHHHLREPHEGRGTARRRHAPAAPHLAIGIRDRPMSFHSPWQNGYVERLIGAIRRECTDHLIVFNAANLRRILTKYAAYYNG